MGLAGNIALWGARAALLSGAGLFLAACTSTGDTAQMAMLPQAAPVQSSTVASNNLPPIGADGSVQVANPTPGAMAEGDTFGAPPSTATTDSMQTASTGYDGSFVSLNDINADNSTGTGRDLNGGLSVEKLLGGWTVSSGDVSCRLNLTYSPKAGTDRYRASAPNCAIPVLASVASWGLVGGQIQLFNDSGRQIANLLQSGGRFIGALAGGQGISMAG
jgi:hypothetical protein